jgi:hypothetical protein
MYTLIRSITNRSIASQQILSFIIAFGIADLFFKWHSFALETFGFLAVWFVLDFVVGWSIKMVRQIKK